MGDKSDGGAMQKAMYNGENYCKQMEKILPWMENRGYFEWTDFNVWKFGAKNGQTPSKNWDYKLC